MERVPSEKTHEKLKEVFRREIDRLTHFIGGEIGAFKAEIYNHLHAIENRIDHLIGRETDEGRNFEELRASLESLKVRLDNLDRKLDEVYSKLRHLDSAVLFLIVLNVITLVLVAALLFRMFTMP